MEAESAFRRSIELSPAHATTRYNLAIALAEQSRFADAEIELREALRLAPDYSEAHKALARVLDSLGRKPDAITFRRRALDENPDDFELLLDLGTALAPQGATASEAIILLRQALRLQPKHADAMNSLGLAHMTLGEYAEAQLNYEAAMTIEPGFASVHANLGTNYKEQGRLAEALACYDLAIRLEPDPVSARWNRALTLLQAGDYERGWAEYESRWRRQTSPPRPFRQPIWDGSELQGRRVFLWCEQGLGDAVQFARYAQLVKERGGFVIFECPSPMAHVLRTCGGIDHFIVEGEPLPDFDVHMPILSGPFLLKTTLASVPASIPYVFAEAPRVDHWRRVIQSRCKDELRLGIAWQGNPHHPLDRFRSAALEDLRPLARIEGIKLFSLQRGPGSEQLDRWAQDLNVEELTRREVVGAEDWADTAAIMKCMDVVVSVDTAVAHVAGALGVPTWVALAASPDWRWMLKRGDTPWYPTMRLFRQQTLRNWRPVFAEMADELKWQMNGILHRRA